MTRLAHLSFPSLTLNRTCCTEPPPALIDAPPSRGERRGSPQPSSSSPLWLRLLPLTVSPVAAEPVVPAGRTWRPASHSERVAGLDTSQQVDVQLALNLRDRGGVSDLIKSVSAPGVTDYGHYLTSQQFGDRFGPTQQQVNAAVTVPQVQRFDRDQRQAGQHAGQCHRYRPCRSAAPCTPR